MPAKYVVALASEVPPGSRKLVTAGGRPIVIFNVKGDYLAILNKCPHQGAPLCAGHLTGLVTSSGPGRMSIEREGEIVMCPNHGWEFDLRTGQSWFDPAHCKVKTYLSEVTSGRQVVEGPYKAETFEVEVDADYLVLTV